MADDRGAGRVRPDSAALIADPARNIFLLGGRVSDSIAALLSIHLRQIRPTGPPAAGRSGTLAGPCSCACASKDVLVLFDFRRYQADLARLAEIVGERSASAAIVLITDKWMSPVARYSDHVVALPIEIGTAWDTLVGAIAFVEALIVQGFGGGLAGHAGSGIEAWDALRLGRSGKTAEDKP